VTSSLSAHSLSLRPAVHVEQVPLSAITQTSGGTDSVILVDAALTVCTDRDRQ